MKKNRKNVGCLITNFEKIFTTYSPEKAKKVWQTVKSS